MRGGCVREEMRKEIGKTAVVARRVRDGKGTWLLLTCKKIFEY